MRIDSINIVPVCLACLCAGFFIQSAAAAGGILYTQPATDFGLSPVESTSFLSNQTSTLPDPQRSKAFDNFTLAVDSEVQDVHWTGAFRDASFDGEIGFIVDIYPNDDGAKPDITNKLMSFELDAGTAGIDDGTEVMKHRLEDQLTRDGGPVFEYWVDVDPFPLDAGTYWVSIVAVDQPNWGWRLGDDGDDNAWHFLAGVDPAEPGTQINRDFAFDITGVPEPRSSSFALLLAALCCRLAASRRQKG